MSEEKIYDVVIIGAGPAGMTLLFIHLVQICLL